MTNIQQFEGWESNCNTVSAIVAAAVRSPSANLFSTAYLMAMRGSLATPVLDATDFYESEAYQEYAADNESEPDMLLDAITAAFLDIENPSEFPVTYCHAKLTVDPFRVSLPSKIPATKYALNLATACYYLQQLSGVDSWFLSSRTASIFSGLKKSRSAQIMNSFVRANILILTTPHTREKAAEYRYIQKG